MDYPEILTTRVLTATAELFKFPEFILQNMVPSESIEGDLAEWDVVEPNTQIDSDFVARDGQSQPSTYTVVKHQTANLLHTFKHKVISPEHLENLRGVGTRARNSESHIAREQEDLVRRHGALMDEWMLWSALSGTLTVKIGGSEQSLSYAIPAGNRPTASVSWATASTDILSDIRDWKDVVITGSSRTPTMAYFNSSMTPYFINNTTLQNYLANSAEGYRVVSEGMVSRLMGIRLIEWDGVYKNASGTVTKFIPDDKFIMLPEFSADWMKMFRGTVAIPGGEGNYQIVQEGFYTKVSYDPVALLLYYKVCRLPAITVPKCVLYADVTP
jgi:hypothetical protein